MEDTITNEEVWAGPSASAENGWRKDVRWRYSNGGQWGDDAIAGFTSYYSKPGTNWKAEISYYVEATRTENQPEVLRRLRGRVHSARCISATATTPSPTTRRSPYDYGDVGYFDTFEGSVRAGSAALNRQRGARLQCLISRR